MTTLRRELRLKFEEILKSEAVFCSDGLENTSPYREEISALAEKLADTAFIFLNPVRTTEPKPEPKFDFAKAGLDWQIAAGVEIKQETIDEAVLEKAALDTFERDMQVASNWEWYPAKGSNERAWKYLREFVVNVYKEDKKAFEKYQTWRTQPFARGAMSNLAIKRRPEDFPSSWTDFLASTMYEKPRRVVSDDERTDLDATGAPISY